VLRERYYNYKNYQPNEKNENCESGLVCDHKRTRLTGCVFLSHDGFSAQVMQGFLTRLELPLQQVSLSYKSLISPP